MSSMVPETTNAANALSMILVTFFMVALLDGWLKLAGLELIQDLFSFLCRHDQPVRLI